MRVSLALLLLVAGCATDAAGDPLINAKRSARDQRAQHEANTLERLELEKAAAAEALARAGCRYEDTALVREAEGRYRVEEGCPALAAVIVRCDFKGAWAGGNRCQGFGVSPGEEGVE